MLRGIIMLRFLPMKQVIKNGFFLGCIILIVTTYSCLNESEPEVRISTDKTSIKANNKDKVVFSVTVDGVDITSSVRIIQKNENTPVEGTSFATDSAATYTFFAIYDNIRSNEISIDVVDIEVILMADKQAIKANDKDMVTFSVEVDDEDMTSTAEIIQVESSESMSADSAFHTKIPGEYTFYAVYNGKRSNEIHVDASAINLSLSVDKTSIKADNSDKAIFFVMADDEDVTSSAVIMQRIVNNNYRPLENNEFYTDEVNYYAFYADYEGVTSDEVVVEATHVELAFLKCYSIVQISSTTFWGSPLMTEELEKFKKNFSDQIHVITLHPSGKYCESDLSGIFGQTAVDFIDRSKLCEDGKFRPLAIVDLHNPVALYVRDTQKYLENAVDQATRARNWVSLTGMAVRSTINGSKIDVNVSFKTVETGNYRFFAFIVEDGVVNRQALQDEKPDLNFVFNNVGTYKLTEGDLFLGVDLGTIVAGRELTRYYSIDTNDFRVGRIVNLANCRIVCYTLRSNDGWNYFVDNVTNCPVNGSVRYRYEKQD